jgi:hypothetical protein
MLTEFEDRPLPEPSVEWEPTWYDPSDRERQLIEYAPSARQVCDQGFKTLQGILPGIRI